MLYTGMCSEGFFCNRNKEKKYLTSYHEHIYIKVTGEERNKNKKKLQSVQRNCHGQPKKKKKIPFLLGEAAGSDLSRPGICAKVISRCQSKNIYIYQ